MRIQLAELIGPQCTALGEGDTLYQQLYPEMKAGQSVELDFSGVETLFSPFLMGSFGKLLQHFEKETLMQRLILCNVSQENLKMVNEFIDRAEQRLTEENNADSMKELFEEDELGDI